MPVQTGPEAHPVSCTVGTESFLGVKRPERGADQPPPPTAKLLVVWSYLLFNSVPAHACHGVNFTFLSSVFYEPYHSVLGRFYQVRVRCEFHVGRGIDKRKVILNPNKRKTYIEQI